MLPFTLQSLHVQHLLHTAGHWLPDFSFLGVTTPSSVIFTSFFCGPNIIYPLFFCDTDSWISFSCSDTHFVEMVCLVTLSTSILGSLVVTFTFYIYIISIILGIPWAQGQRRAFCTCTAHLTVVILWYDSIIFLYIRCYHQTYLIWTKLLIPSILLWLPCWILSFTLSGTWSWRKPWEKH